MGALLAGVPVKRVSRRRCDDSGVSARQHTHLIEPPWPATALLCAPFGPDIGATRPAIIFKHLLLRPPWWQNKLRLGRGELAV